MGIGTSKGAFYEDEFHFRQSQWDPKYDENEITPNQMENNRQMQQFDQSIDNPEGGIEVAYKAPESELGKWLHGDSYDTELTPDQQIQYNKKYGNYDTRDYDMQGYFKANPNVDPNAPGVHYPDTFKKPNHPTFSMDSQYNGRDGKWGGVWGTEDGKDTFTPSSTNLTNMTKEELQDYFKRVEPNAILKLPTPQIEDRRSEEPPSQADVDLMDDMSGLTSGEYWYDDNKVMDNKSLTPLEKQAGARDIDNMELDKVIARLRSGIDLSAKKYLKP